MNAALDILAAGAVVQGIAWPLATLIFGLRLAPQLRVAPPAKAPEAPRQEPASEPARTGPVSLERAS